MGGHGAQIDENGDEVDKRDEVLVSADFKPNKKFDASNVTGLTDDEWITDDWLREQVLQLKCESFFFLETCHSGTLLDLDYEYNDGAMVNISKRVGSPVNRPLCVLLSPSRDSQTGKQIRANFPDKKTGKKTIYHGSALSRAVNTTLKEKPNISIGDLLRESRLFIADELEMGNNIPQLSAFYPLDLNTPFEQLYDGVTPPLKQAEPGKS